MKRLTQLFSAILVALLITILPAFVATGVAEHLRVMLHTGSFPPYFFKEGAPQTGTIKDVFTALGKETGDTLEYVRVPFKRALHMFETGEIDIEPMSNPAWRQASAVPGFYSIPYTVSEEVLLVRAGKSFSFHSPKDLIGKQVGVIQGYRYPEYEPYFESGAIIPQPLRNENELVRMLLVNRLDQVLINKDFAQYQMLHQKVQDKLTIIATNNAPEVMIRFHPDKKEVVERFNKAIRKLLDNGTITRIYDQYR